MAELHSGFEVRPATLGGPVKNRKKEGHTQDTVSKDVMKQSKAKLNLHSQRSAALKCLLVVCHGPG